MLSINIQWLPHGQGLPVPAHATQHSAGLDLAAAIEDHVVIEPGAIQLIPTGFYIAIPVGYEGQIRPRSGLALKHGITVLNAPGTVDADYRGEVCVILINHGTQPFTVERGMRIAQLVVTAYQPCVLNPIENGTLKSTARCMGGFGSTGL